YYFFVIPSGLVVGGSTGIAMIVSRYVTCPDFGSFIRIQWIVFTTWIVVFGKKGILSNHLWLVTVPGVFSLI
ncbi:MAG: hypothetical protein PHQ30_05455, partial [Candidatus Izemoplasmatales bacterium]|nr:hypothetical protein [Candidatus Izemoplasmatales bacterium]